MKLPKKDLNKYHYVLQECIRSRKDWITYYTVKLRWSKLKSKVNFHMIWNNPILGLLVWLINLPTLIYRYFITLKLKYELEEIETEIEIIKREIIHVDQIRWNKEEKNIKILK